MLSHLISAAVLLSPAFGSLLNATFSSPEAPHCGKGTPAEGNAVTFNLEAIPVNYSLCLNVNDIFTNPNTTFFGTTVWSDDPSQAWLYNLTGAEHYNASANYSRVFFQQEPWNPKEGGKDGEVGTINLRVYNGKDC